MGSFLDMKQYILVRTLCFSDTWEVMDGLQAPFSNLNLAIKQSRVLGAIKQTRSSPNPCDLTGLRMHLRGNR